MLKSTRILLLCALAAGALVGCGGPDQTPDMELQVTFNGGLGCFDAGVNQVRITFETGDVGTIGPVPCDTAGGITVVVRDVPVGHYRVFAEGLDNGAPVYSDRFDIDHSEAGSHLYPLDLRPETELVANFTFAAPNVQGSNVLGMTCEQAGVATVNLLVGQVAYNGVPCSANGRDAAALLGVPTGTQTISLDAFDSAGNKLYSSSFDGIAIQGGASNEFTFNALPLVKGGLAIQWDCNGANCSQQGVSTVEFQLVDATGHVVDTEGLASTQFPVTYSHSSQSSALTAGLYSLTYIRGKAANGTVLFQARAVPLYAPAGSTPTFQVTLAR